MSRCHPSSQKRSIIAGKASSWSPAVPSIYARNLSCRTSDARSRSILSPPQRRFRHRARFESGGRRVLPPLGRSSKDRMLAVTSRPPSDSPLQDAGHCGDNERNLLRARFLSHQNVPFTESRLLISTGCGAGEGNRTVHADPIVTGWQCRRECVRHRSLNVDGGNAIACVQWLCTDEEHTPFQWL